MTVFFLWRSLLSFNWSQFIFSSNNDLQLIVRDAINMYVFFVFNENNFIMKFLSNESIDDLSSFMTFDAFHIGLFYSILFSAFFCVFYIFDLFIGTISINKLCIYSLAICIKWVIYTVYFWFICRSIICLVSAFFFYHRPFL